MTNDDIKDWKQNVVTQNVMNLLAENRQECLEALPDLLLRSNDKEIGYRAGWIDCLAAALTLLENVSIHVRNEGDEQANAPILSVKDYLAKRIG